MKSSKADMTFPKSESYGDDEDDDKPSAVAEAAGEKIGDRDGADLRRVLAQALGHEQPVEIGQSSLSYACFACLCLRLLDLLRFACLCLLLLDRLCVQRSLCLREGFRPFRATPQSPGLSAPSSSGK